LHHLTNPYIKENVVYISPPHFLYHFPSSFFLSLSRATSSISLLLQCLQGNVMGPCTCGTSHTQTTSFSMPFSVTNHKQPYQDSDIYDYSFSSSSSSSSSVVDCTLSLGTPSTRFSQDQEKPTRHHQRTSVSNFCWDLLQSKHSPQSQTKSSRTPNTTSNTDPLIARRCANCDTTSTPLWRNGPRGPKVNLNHHAYHSSKLKLYISLFQNQIQFIKKKTLFCLSFFLYNVV